ncbi:hypothetical protein NHQ30_000024 [Ciborinia camelliae]|nr:hypothetical protein NHQ30_000024 [Ciborinia camelliae]
MPSTSSTLISSSPSITTSLASVTIVNILSNGVSSPSVSTNLITSTSITSSQATLAASTSQILSSTTSSSTAAASSDPVTSSNLGVNFAYFTNPTFNSGYGYPQFDVTTFNGKNPIYNGTSTQTGFPNTAPGSNATLYPGAPSRSVEQLAIVHTGFVYARKAGTYTFTITDSNDIVMGWIGSNAYSAYSANNTDLLTAYFGISGAVMTVSRTLTAGQFLPFRVLYANGVGNAVFGFTIQGPDSTLLSPTIASAKDIITTPPSGTQAFSFPVVASTAFTCTSVLTFSEYTNPFTQTLGNLYTTFKPSYFASGQTPFATGKIQNINFVSTSSAYKQTAIVYQGFFAASAAGAYTFVFAAADDIGYLYFGDGAGNRFNDTNYVGMATLGGGGTSTPFVFTASAGEMVPVTIVYGNTDGTSALQLNVITPDGLTLSNSTQSFKSGTGC